jgi:hypothetical protein
LLDGQRPARQRLDLLVFRLARARVELRDQFFDGAARGLDPFGARGFGKRVELFPRAVARAEL